MTDGIQSIEADNKRACAETHAGTSLIRFGGVRTETSDRSDRQRELRALVFLSDDCRNQHQSPDSSDVPAFRYGETEFSYEGRQERLDLCDTSINSDERS